MSLGPRDRLPRIPEPMPLPTFATFYTDDAYLEVSRRLERCCRLFGLPFLRVRGEDLGSWQRNCNQKPRLLLDVRRQLRGPVVWLDADCIIQRRPALLLEEHDDDALLWLGGVCNTEDYISSQTTWWNDSPAALGMIEGWAALSLEHPGSLADPLLKRICTAWRGRAAIGRLPDAYLKPYWFDVEGVTPAEIVISSNERVSDKPDGLYARDRRRLDPLVLPWAPDAA
jgi:hypothetical protein